MGISDLACQALEKCAVQGGGESGVVAKREEGWWDSRRTLAFVSCGLVATGPAQQIWNFGIERVFPGTGVRAIASKTAANAVLALVYGLPAVFTFTTLASPGGTVELSWRKIKRDLFDVWMAGNLYMPFVHALVFNFVAVQHRSVVSDAFRGVFNIYVSYRANAGLGECI